MALITCAFGSRMLSPVTHAEKVTFLLHVFALLIGCALANDGPKVNALAPDGYTKILGQYLPGFAKDHEDVDIDSEFSVEEAVKMCDELGAACTGFTCSTTCTLRSGGSLLPSDLGEVSYKKKTAVSGTAVLPSKGISSSQIGLKLQGDLVQDWEMHMDGFVPELQLTFPLPPRTDEYFYEDVTPPATLRGAFFASNGEETSSVDFKIISPSGEVVFEKDGSPDGLFHIMARKKGAYTFMVSNHRWLEQKTVTFALGTGNTTNVKQEHVDAVDSQIQVISKELKDIQSESSFLWIRQKAHMKAVEAIHTRVFWFCVIELLILAGVSACQVYYIKGMLSDRRVI